MIQISNYLLFIYLIYLGILIFIFVKSILKFKNYDKGDLWFSELGKTNERSSHLFNLGIKLFGALSFALVFKLFLILPRVIETYMILIFLTLVSTGTLLVGFIPMNRKPLIHGIIAVVIFVSIILYGIFSAILNSNINIFPQNLILLNYCFYALIPIGLIGGILDYYQVNLRKFNIFILISGFVEWSVVILTLVWNIYMTIFLLSYSG